MSSNRRTLALISEIGTISTTNLGDLYNPFDPDYYDQFFIGYKEGYRMNMGVHWYWEKVELKVADEMGIIREAKSLGLKNRILRSTGYKPKEGEILEPGDMKIVGSKGNKVIRAKDIKNKP